MCLRPAGPKAVKHEAAGSVQVLGPAPGSLDNLADDIGYGYSEFRRYDCTSAAVPSDGVPEIFSCIRVKAELLTSHQGIL